jgi:hypothetical protein
VKSSHTFTLIELENIILKPKLKWVLTQCALFSSASLINCWSSVRQLLVHVRRPNRTSYKYQGEQLITDWRKLPSDQSNISNLFTTRRAYDHHMKSIFQQNGKSYINRCQNALTGSYLMYTTLVGHDRPVVTLIFRGVYSCLHKNTRDVHVHQR